MKESPREAGIVISGAAYHLPETRIPFADLWARDAERIAALRAQVRLSPKLKELQGFGIDTVPDAGDTAPWELARPAAEAALAQAGVAAGELDLLVDFSTTAPGGNGVPVGYRLQDELGAERARVLTVGSGACASLHGALATASALLTTDERLTTALLVAGDKVHPEARVLFPLSVLGDGGSALVLRRGGDGANDGDRLLATELKTVGFLHGAVGLPRGATPASVHVPDFERRLLISHLKAVREVGLALLERSGQTLDHVSLLLPPNMSATDQDGYAKVLGIPPAQLYRGALREAGHLFASDGVVNWCRAREDGRLRPGALVLLLAAGAGFAWGGSLVRVG